MTEPGALPIDAIIFVPAILIGVTIWLALPDWRHRWQVRRVRRLDKQHLLEDHELAIEVDALVETLNKVERAVHYRYNEHCPGCGRFARTYADLPWMTDCATCGPHTRSQVWTGSFDIPVSWLAPDDLLVGVTP